MLQDLVCVRLIQSGQYLEAIKLDQQFASTRLGRGPQAQQAAERRRKLIEDVIAALPSIEREEIEEKLREVGQRKPGALTKPVQTKAPAADLSMSWEEIPPPPPAPRLPPIASGAPRFVLGRPAYGHNQSKPVGGPSTEASSAQPVRALPAPARTQATENTVPPGLNGASHVRNYAPPTLSLPASRAGPAVGLFGSGPQTSKPSLNSLSSGGRRPSPLFPSNTSQDSRQLIGNQTVPPNQKAAPPQEPHVKEPSLQQNVVSQPGAETRSNGTDRHDVLAQASEPVPVIEFSEPVFLSSRPERVALTREPTEPLLPGAFRPEREVAQPKANPFAHSPPSPPRQLRAAKSRKTARTSVPGGFDDDASGEEDNVPPLPEVSPVKRTTRQRVSRASSNDGEDESAPTKPRRSSRLSAASSSSDPSPPKVSAPKATRKTRGSAGSSATTGIASSTRSSTRKRR